MIWATLCFLISVLMLVPATSAFAIYVAYVMAWLTVGFELCFAVFCALCVLGKAKDEINLTAIKRTKSSYVVFQNASVFMLAVLLGSAGYEVTASVLLLSLLLAITAIVNIRVETNEL